MSNTTTNGRGLKTSEFITELQALPVVNDGITVASDLYKWTKGYRCENMAVGVTSVSMWAATTVPLAALAHSVGGWETLDKWACHRLQTVKTWAPSISKPTTEMVGDVREKLLEVVAGCPIELSTLAGALAARVENTVSKLKEYETGRTVVAAADGLVDKAHNLVDLYLPTVEGDLNESDGRDGGLVLKSLALAVKTQLRAYRAAHVLVHADKDCNESSTAHIASCASNYAKEWFSLAVSDVHPDDLTVIKITANLSLQITRHIAVTLQTLATVTATLSTASPAQFAMAYLFYARGVAERTLLIMAFVFLLVKVSCAAARKSTLEFRVWLAVLLQNVMMVLRPKKEVTSS